MKALNRFLEGHRVLRRSAIRCLTICFIAWFSAAVVHAQTTDKESLPPDGVVKRFFLDELKMWSSPSRLHPSDAKWLTPLALSEVALFRMDRSVIREVAETDDLHQPSRVVSALGGGPMFAVPAAMMVVGKVSHRDGLSETGGAGLRAVAHATVIGQVMKQIAGRERPTSGEGHGSFRAGGTSFPSGHAMASWAFATAVASRSNKKWVKVASYSFAAAVGLSRVGGRHHFPSDVLAGSAMGYFIGRYTVRH